VHIIRYNPDKLPGCPKLSIADRNSLVLERLRVALEQASLTFDDQSLLTVEYLFYYDIPHSLRDNDHVQTLRFKNECEYNAWFDSALPSFEANTDRKEYARLASIPIAKQNEQSAGVKQEKLKQQVTEVLDRVMFLAAAKMLEAGE
jgi:hypothetical protein